MCSENCIYVDFMFGFPFMYFLILLLEVTPGSIIAHGAAGPGCVPLWKEETSVIVYGSIAIIGVGPVLHFILIFGINDTNNSHRSYQNGKKSIIFNKVYTPIQIT